jgi:hypothetical protein
MTLCTSEVTICVRYFDSREAPFRLHCQHEAIHFPGLPVFHAELYIWLYIRNEFSVPNVPL